MKKYFSWRNWTIGSITLALVIVNILLVSSLSKQNLSPFPINSLQSTPLSSKNTLQSGIIPDTGNERGVRFDTTTAGWSLWVFLGTVLLYILLLLIAQGGFINPSP